jgi:hypothetical protein
VLSRLELLLSSKRLILVLNAVFQIEENCVKEELFYILQRGWLDL